MSYVTDLIKAADATVDQKGTMMLDVYGKSGLKMQGGRVTEEWHPSLRGKQGVKIYREMTDNDPTVGAVFYAIKALVREVPWFVKPADESPKALEWAEFVDGCREDMSHTWDDMIIEALSMLGYGWAYHELCYKRRLGLNPPEGQPASRFNDGKIGWRKIALRGQETLERWEKNDDGFIKGMWQRIDGGTAFIPLEKALLFRTEASKSNPEGRSILRNAYRPYRALKRIEDLECIRYERDTTGVPDIQVPAEYLMSTATAEQKAIVSSLQTMGQQMRNDERSVLVRPSELDSDGKPTGFKFGLIAGAGAKQADAGPIITRKKHEIATVALMDWIHLGQDKVGSWALASSKTNMSSRALRALLKSIQEPLNRFAIPRLMELNNAPEEFWPTIEHGDVEAPPLEEIGAFVEKMINAGMIQPSDSDERFVRQIARMPEKEEPEHDHDETIGGGAQVEAVDPTQALNDAQVTAMLEILDRVAAGRLPRESGINAIAASFPLSREDAERIMGEVGKGFVPVSTGGQ